MGLLDDVGSEEKGTRVWDYYDDDDVHVVNKKKNEKRGHELPNYTYMY